MKAGDENWPAAMGNSRNYWKSWVRMTRILVWEGADTRISGMFSNAVVQEVFLFRSDKWVLIPRMERALGSFNHRVAQRITGRHMRRQA